MQNLNVAHLVILLVVVMLPIALAIAALVSVGRSQASGEFKALWVLIVIVAPFLGALAWFIFGRRWKNGRT